MALKGFPVVVVAEGGAPFVLVESGAPLATVAENGMGTPITPVTAHAPPLVLSDPILSIFADGTDGFYFDFSKTDRLFQDINGTTPADGPGENIALALESHAWQGRTLAELVALQPELYPQPDFNASTGLTLGAGWAVGGGLLTGTATSAAATAVALLPGGKLYRRQLQVVTLTNGSLRFDFTGSAGPSISAAGDAVSFGTPSSGASRDAAIQGVSSFSGTIDSASIKEIPGNHGLQATTSAQPKWQTGGLARFDGSDDNLMTTLNPAASFSMMFKGKITSASKIVMGSRETTDTRAFIGTDAAGLLAAGVGADSTATIKGGSDIRGTTGVGALVYSASGVELYWNGVSVYSGALNGSPNTTIPLALGALNDNGTASTFADADIYYALAIKKALTAAGIQAVTNLWGTT